MKLRYTAHLYNPITEDYKLFENKTAKQLAKLWSIRQGWYLTATRQQTRYNKIVFKAGITKDGTFKVTHNNKVLAAIENNKLTIPIDQLTIEEKTIATAFGHMIVG